MLREWLEFRRDRPYAGACSTGWSRCWSRLHILDGLLIAFLNIDEVIRIIRSEDRPKPVLMERFGLSDEQAEAILELKLRHLAKLEEMKIRGEQAELATERDALQKTLGSEARLTALMRKELLAVAEEFGDARRSPLVEREEARAYSETELVASEPITVVLSEQGLDPCGEGSSTSTVRSSATRRETAFCAQCRVAVQPAGRAARLERSQLCTGGACLAVRARAGRAADRPYQSAVGGSGSWVLLMGDDANLYLLASDAGYGFVVRLADLLTKNRAGKAVLTLPEGAEVLPPVRVRDAARDLLVAVSNEGRMLVFPVAELPMTRAWQGQSGSWAFPPRCCSAREEFLLAALVLGAQDGLVIMPASAI
jgi:topoisomerase-4 subunit A